MRKWIVIGTMLGLVVIAVSLFLVHQAAYGTLHDTKEHLERQILQVEGVNAVNEWQQYYGDQAMYVATVEISDTEDEYWFFNEDLERFETIARSELLTKEEAEQIVEDEAASLVEVRDVALGFEDGDFMYEIIYIDEERTHVYHYISAEDGTTDRVYRLG